MGHHTAISELFSEKTHKLESRTLGWTMPKLLPRAYTGVEPTPGAACDGLVAMLLLHSLR